MPTTARTELRQIRRRLDQVRADRDASPLGRYDAGRAAGTVEAARARDAADVRTMRALAQVLRAAVSPIDGPVVEALHRIHDQDPHLLTAVQAAADRVATCAAQVGAGVR